MLGHVGMRHAVVWSQATDATAMKLTYWEQGQSMPVALASYGKRDEYNCSVYQIDGLEPNVRYEGFIQTVDGRSLSDTIYVDHTGIVAIPHRPPSIHICHGKLCVYQ